MQIQSPLADIRLSIDSISQDGSMVRLDATQQPGQVPTTAYLTPGEVAQFVAAFLKPSLLFYLFLLFMFFFLAYGWVNVFIIKLLYIFWFYCAILLFFLFHSISDFVPFSFDKYTKSSNCT